MSKKAVNGLSEIREIKLKDLLFQIQSIKDNSQAFLPDDESDLDEDKAIWKDDVDACTGLIEIVNMLHNKGCYTIADALKYISEEKG